MSPDYKRELLVSEEKGTLLGGRENLMAVGKDRHLNYKSMNWNSKDWDDLDEPLISDQAWKNMVVLAFIGWILYQIYK